MNITMLKKQLFIEVCLEKRSIQLGNLRHLKGRRIPSEPSDGSHDTM